jgi:hypothetical protein
MKRIVTLFGILASVVFTAGQAIGANGPVTTHLYQDVAGTPGVQYTLTGWAGAGAGYIGLVDPNVKSQFTIDFLNASNAVIGGNTIDLNTMGLGVSGLPNPFGYNTYSVSATAPAGTVKVRALATQGNAYANPAGGDQAFVVDSFTLSPPSGGNLLSNPDLDVIGVGDQVLATPINGWHVDSTRVLTGPFTDGASSESFANVLQPGGFGLFFKAFQGDTVPEPTTIGLGLLGLLGVIGLVRRR